MAIVQGDYVYLRPYEMDDIDIVLAGANEPVGARLTGTHGGGFTREQIERYIQMNIDAEMGSRYGWVICRTEDDTVVGEVVINEVDNDNHNASIRIALYDPKYFGKGYGTAAMRQAIDYVFRNSDLHRISLGVYAFNPRAIHVYEKVGFTLEGTLRDTLYWDGEYHDEYVMSILRTDWQ